LRETPLNTLNAGEKS